MNIHSSRLLRRCCIILLSALPVGSFVQAQQSAEPVLVALPVVDKGAVFHVYWAGASNEGDLLLLHNEEQQGPYLDKQPVTSGQPAMLTAPDEAGLYYILYFHKPSRMIAMVRELEVR